MTQINIRGTEDELAERAVRRDALARKSPAEIDAWIDANVTGLADVKQVLKLLTRGLRVTLKPSRVVDSSPL